MTTIAAPADMAPASTAPREGARGAGGQDGTAADQGLFATLLGDGAGKGAGKGDAGGDADGGADPRGKPRRTGGSDAADALIASLVPQFGTGAPVPAPAGAAALLAGQPGTVPTTPPAPDTAPLGGSVAAGAASASPAAAGTAPPPGALRTDSTAQAASAPAQAGAKGKPAATSKAENRPSPGIAGEGKVDGAAQPNVTSAPSQAKAAADAIAGQLLTGRSPGDAAPEGAARTAQPAAVEALPPLPSHAAAHYAPRLSTEAAAMRPHPPVGQMAAQMAEPLVRVAGAGGGEFHIDLSPPDLGRVHVVADVADGQVSLDIQVESSDTLLLLRRDMHHLERALGDAGLKLDTANLQFSLRGDDQPRGFMTSDQGSGGQRQQGWRAPTEMPADDAPPERPRLSIDGVVDVIV